MRKFNGREMKAFFILSIVVPVGLLTTLRLTGIIAEPQIAETTLELKEWVFQRPSQFVYIDDKLYANYTGDGLFSTMYLIIWVYSDNSQSGADSDYLMLEVVINATTTNSNGYMKNVDISLRKELQISTIDWLETERRFDNLSLQIIQAGYRWNNEAYIKFTGDNQPEDTHVEALAMWSLYTSNNESHLLEATYELTYYNGTAYKKIIQPFQLNVLGR